MACRAALAAFRVVAYGGSMSESGRHPEVGRFIGAILPQARPGRIALVLVTALLTLFTALQVLAAVFSGGKPWLVLVIIPLGIGAIAAVGSIARLSQSILPQTQLGWIAVWLFIVFFVLAAATAVIVAVSGGHPWLAFFVIPLGIAALGGGAAAVVSIVRRGERAALVLMPLIVGLLALFFVAGELLAPH
jgi:hypothetical protein